MRYGQNIKCDCELQTFISTLDELLTCCLAGLQFTKIILLRCVCICVSRAVCTITVLFLSLLCLKKANELKCLTHLAEVWQTIWKQELIKKIKENSTENWSENSWLNAVGTIDLKTYSKTCTSPDHQKDHQNQSCDLWQFLPSCGCDMRMHESSQKQKAKARNCIEMVPFLVMWVVWWDIPCRSFIIQSGIFLMKKEFKRLLQVRNLSYCSHRSWSQNTTYYTQNKKMSGI